MAITVRKGNETQFDINKMLPGEFAVTTDTGKVFVCTSAGNTKELASVEELRNILDTSGEAFDALRELINALENEEVITGLLNDINNLKSGEYNIIFSEAEEATNIESTDTLKIILGKIKKIFSSLKNVAFSGDFNDLENKPLLGEAASKGVANNDTTTEEGYVADARIVKAHGEKLAAIGNYYNASVSGDISVPSKKGTGLLSLELPKGTYILTAGVRFAANATGNRYINISSTSGGATNQVNGIGNASFATQLNLAICMNLTSSVTLWLNAYQDSGVDLNCVSGGMYFRAIRIS